ncbi:hypothetical protein T265_13397, partial [Opisthorchis viverrini]
MAVPGFEVPASDVRGKHITTTPLVHSGLVRNFTSDEAFTLTSHPYEQTSCPSCDSTPKRGSSDSDFALIKGHLQCVPLNVPGAKFRTSDTTTPPAYARRT